MVVIGLALSTGPFNDIVQEAQGHCDYLPCVTSTTVPFLVAMLAVVLIGAFALVLGTSSIRRRCELAAQAVTVLTSSCAARSLVGDSTTTARLRLRILYTLRKYGACRGHWFESITAHHVERAARLS